MGHTQKLHTRDTEPSVLGEQLIAENRAATFLCISVRTLQAWRVQGVGPRFCKIGRAVRYRSYDLETWIEARSRSSTSDRAHST